MHKTENRKNYSISLDSSRKLARIALDLSEQLIITVHKQTILEVLILSLKDKYIFDKVKKIISDGNIKGRKI